MSSDLEPIEFDDGWRRPTRRRVPGEWGEDHGDEIVELIPDELDLDDWPDTVRALRGGSVS